MIQQTTTSRQGRRQSPHSNRPRLHGSRGVAIIGVLFFILIVSILLMGVGTYCVANQTNVLVDADYAQAMDLAEAGINFEFRKLSLSTANPDQSPGGTYTLGPGTFTVYCTNKDGTTPWTVGSNLYVISTGTVDGVSRTVKVSSKMTIPMGNFAIFTMGGLSIWKGGSMDITGDVGTDATLDFNSTPNISGSVYLYGSGASLVGGHTSDYTINNQSNALTWPTVDSLASQTVSGGMGALATTNDNAKAIPPIVGNSITSDVTLPAGNYYVTNIDLKANHTINFNNAAGPVNIWVGPSGGSGTCTFRGGSAAIPIATDATKACHVYVATASGIDMAGNETVDALVYAYNKDASGNPYGYVNLSGNPTINGEVLGNQVDVNGNVKVNYKTSLVQPTGGGYYGYDNSWAEVGGR